MLQPFISVAQNSNSLTGPLDSAAPLFPHDSSKRYRVITGGFARRWRRERRRRKVGRAYDMALEIAQLIPRGSRVLDVGCGSGFIAQHLSGLVGAKVTGIDLSAKTETPIDYQQFDGKHFPVADCSVDAALFCYVLHHAQDLTTVMKELRRVLTPAGMAVVYEDIPAAAWDRVVCLIHHLKWHSRTGPCRFLSATEWSQRFNAEGFAVVSERPLSRWRNLSHPVRRRIFVLRQQP